MLAEMELSTSQKYKLFEIEFYPLMDSLYNFAYRLTFNEDDAKDLVQETYLKAYRFINHYQKGTNAKAWLFRILKNSFINNYRKESKEPDKVDYEEIKKVNNSDEGGSQVYNNTFDLRAEMFQNLLGDEISNALNSLPVDFRVIILLADVEEFTYEEISKIIDIPIGTVRSRLHRARLLLKDKIKDYAATLGFKD